MDNETIRKAAEKSCNKNAPSDPDCSACYRQGFRDGAEWRINSVWHDSNEKPNGMFVILIDFGTEISPEEFGLGLTADDLDGAKRWAYVSDLLPERKEETE